MILIMMDIISSHWYVNGEREEEERKWKYMHRSLDGKWYMRYGLKLSGPKNKSKIVVLSSKSLGSETSLINCPRVDNHDSQRLLLFLPHLLHKYSLHFAGAKLMLFTAPITRAQVCISIQLQVNLALN